MTEHSAADQVVLAPWDTVIRRVHGRGWSLVPRAIRPGLLEDLLLAAAVLPYRAVNAPGGSQTEPETAVAGQPLAGSDPIVQDLAIRIFAGLSVAAQLTRLPVPPMFEEANWVLRRAGTVRVSGGRASARGIAVTVVLGGRADLAVREPTDQLRHLSSAAGDLLAHRGPRSDGCRHRAELLLAPQSDLLTVTLRAASG